MLDDVDPVDPIVDPPPASNRGNDEIRMTQAEFNAKLAQHKRTLQRELADAKSKASAFDALQSQVTDLLQSGIIDGVEDIDGFRTAAAETIEKSKSEQERAEAANKKIAKDLKTAQELAESHRVRYETAMIERSISDEAAALVVDGAGREGAIEYFQLKLGPKSQVQDDGTVLVAWKVIDPDTGRAEEKMVPVKQALQSMEAEPTKYGRYFRSTVNGGAGGETIDGLKRTVDGHLDLAHMDFQKFRELRQKNPQALREAAEKLAF